MDISNRHIDIINYLSKSDTAVSGKKLSELFGVSRQIIIKDIDKLKRDGYDIIPTSKGYLLQSKDEKELIVKVFHSADDAEKEMNIIVDQGVTIKDVFIYHKIYGEIHAKLGISSRRDVKNFCNALKEGKSKPLSTATGGYHYHTLVGKDNNSLKLVEKELKKHGFIAKRKNYEPEAFSKDL